jgi:hypothetical protein
MLQTARSFSMYVFFKKKKMLRLLSDIEDRYIQEKDEYGTSKGVVKLVHYLYHPDNH